MPVITYEGGKLTTAEKRKLVKRLTDLAVDVTNVPKQFFPVLIRELEDTNLGFAGETVRDLKETRKATLSD